MKPALSSPAFRIKKICQTGNPSCAALVQTGAAESFQIALPLGLVFDWHLLGDPAERNIGLCAPQLLQHGLGSVDVTDRPCRRWQLIPDARQRNRRAAGRPRAPAALPRRNCGRQTGRRKRCRNKQRPAVMQDARPPSEDQFGGCRQSPRAKSIPSRYRKTGPRLTFASQRKTFPNSTAGSCRAPRSGRC